MSRRSRRSTTAISSSATQTAIRQDRDAGAVKRLMTGRAAKPAGAAASAAETGSGGGAASAASAKPPAGVPFTCYRCGQPLTGSLEDRGAHPCLTGLGAKEQRSSASAASSATAQQGELHGALAAKQRRQPAPIRAAKPVELPPVVDETATPAAGNATWATKRDPSLKAGAARTVGQARSALLKRSLPGPDERSPKRRKPDGARRGAPAGAPAPPLAAVAAQEEEEEEAPQPTRRSGRASTAATSKSAASLAYQEKHKARIVSAITAAAPTPAPPAAKPSAKRSHQQDTQLHIHDQDAAAVRLAAPDAQAQAHSLDGKQRKQGEQRKKAALAGAADSTEYEVESILRRRLNQQSIEVEYLVMWKGYDETQASWEPEENLKYVDGLQVSCK